MNRSASMLFIFITILLDSIGLGIIFPALPDVIRKFVTDESSISFYYGYFVATYALLQFLACPLLGRLSDRYGRRPVLLVSLFGAAVDYWFMAFAPTLPLLFIGRFISGVTGANYTVASAYIADVSNDENRSKNFGLLGAGFGLGFIAGPAIGGWIAQYGAHYPFLIASLFNLLNFLFGLFVLPESLGKEMRTNFEIKALNPFRSLFWVFRLPEVRVLVLVYFLLQLAGQTHPSIWTLYTEHRYHWGAAEVGVSLSIMGILSAISQGVLTGKFVSWLGESTVVAFGAIGEGIGFILFGLAATPLMAYTVLIFSSIFWASQPALQSLISKQVPPDRQGELQGTLMSLMSLTGFVNPLLMTSLFALTSNRSEGFYFPGSPYVLGSLLLFAGGIITLRRPARDSVKS